MPANVRELHGNRHKPAAEGVQAVVAVPNVPDYLDAEAKREWKRITPELARLRVLATLDRGLLVAYCRGWSAFLKVEDDQKAAVFYQRTLLPLASKLGVTPIDRLRMRAPAPDEDASVNLLD